MSKSDLVATLQALSEKLGRELSIEGTIPELEARISQAEAELNMLGSNDDDGDSGLLVDGNSGAELLAAELRADNTVDSDKIPVTNVSRRRVKLHTTLDVWHYKKGADRRNPNKVGRVREIVPRGRDILVDSDEAADIIANEHGHAV